MGDAPAVAEVLDVLEDQLGGVRRDRALRALQVPHVAPVGAQHRLPHGLPGGLPEVDPPRAGVSRSGAGDLAGVGQEVVPGPVGLRDGDPGPGEEALVDVDHGPPGPQAPGGEAEELAPDLQEVARRRGQVVPLQAVAIELPLDVEEGPLEGDGLEEGAADDVDVRQGAPRGLHLQLLVVAVPGLHLRDDLHVEPAVLGVPGRHLGLDRLLLQGAAPTGVGDAYPLPPRGQRLPPWPSRHRPAGRAEYPAQAPGNQSRSQYSPPVHRHALPPRRGGPPPPESSIPCPVRGVKRMGSLPPAWLRGHREALAVQVRLQRAQQAVHPVALGTQAGGRRPGRGARDGGGQPAAPDTFVRSVGVRVASDATCPVSRPPRLRPATGAWSPPAQRAAGTRMSGTETRFRAGS